MSQRLKRTVIATLLCLPAPALPAGEDRPSQRRMRQAWEALKRLEVPGVARDQRFAMPGPAFHVRPDGDDAADGSKARPWRTLARACAALAPGRTVYLHAGTYPGPVTIEKVHATAEAPAALRAAEGEAVVVRYPAAWIAAEKARIAKAGLEGNRHVVRDAAGKEIHYPPLMVVKDCRFVEISGLHFIGARDELPHNLYSECGVRFRNGGGRGCRVLYNEIERVGHCGVKSEGDVRGIQVEGNWIHDVGQTAHDHGLYFVGGELLFRRNLVVRAKGWGVHGYPRPEAMRITHNVFLDNHCHGVILGGAGSQVAHNVFAGNRKGGVFLFRGRCRDNRIANNIFLGPAPAVSIDTLGGKPGARPTGNTIDHNLVARGAVLHKVALSGNRVGPGNITAAAGLTDTAALDFRPRPGSPAVGAGVALPNGARSDRPVNIGPYPPADTDRP